MCMPCTHARDSPYTLGDGLGVRTIEATTSGGCVETLNVAAPLASHPAAEECLRARAARYGELPASVVAPVRRIERDGAALRVAADVPEGVRLSDLLTRLDAGETISETSLLDLLAALVGVVAEIHRLPGRLAHGALSPAHAVLTAEGRIVLTDGVFGGALEAMQLNRERLWREFGLALPAAASVPRFDQRADVTQLGALVLAVVLRRPLRADEYPRRVGDLVAAAATDAAVPHASALTMWLQEALQLHPRAAFGSAVGAERAFAGIRSMWGATTRGNRARALPARPMDSVVSNHQIT